MSKTSFYITTTLPYVNADPHMGHALEFIRVDIIARWKRLSGNEVFFNTGTDEHGQKVLQAAEKAGKSPKEYVDEYAARFKKLYPLLGVGDFAFTRTTDAHHVKAVQEFWKRIEKNGYIYKKNYKAKYCVGCEEEKTDSELVDGRCPIHPQLELQIIEEENYFFKLSEFGDKLLSLYESGKFRVVPESRFNEMKEFIKRGLKDFSISRLSSKMPWGVPVPGDAEHVMYVWFDALPNYITSLGWPEDEANFEKFWKNGTPVQYCGKDNTRFQSIMWQAMLLAAGLPSTHTVVINGFVTGEGGVKMSKSLGNVINPVDVVNEYGTDALRYFVAREISPFEDSPFTMDRFKLSYNTNLANGLGNLVSRIMKMATTNGVTYEDYDGVGEATKIGKNFYSFPKGTHYESFDIQKEANEIWKDITALDTYIQREQPFKKVKTDVEAGGKDIAYLLSYLLRIAVRLEPIMPETSKTIQTLVRENKMPDKPLFLRKE